MDYNLRKSVDIRSCTDKVRLGSEGFVWVGVDDCSIIVCCISPNEDTQRFKSFLENVRMKLRRCC